MRAGERQNVAPLAFVSTYQLVDVFQQLHRQRSRVIQVNWCTVHCPWSTVGNLNVYSSQRSRVIQSINVYHQQMEMVEQYNLVDKVINQERKAITYQWRKKRKTTWKTRVLQKAQMGDPRIGACQLSAIIKYVYEEKIHPIQYYIAQIINNIKLLLIQLTKSAELQLYPKHYKHWKMCKFNYAQENRNLSCPWINSSVNRKPAL